MHLDRERIDLLGSTLLEILFVDLPGAPPDIPVVEGLDIQFNGQHTQTRMINFQKTVQQSYRYRVTPKKTGLFTIGPLEIPTPAGTQRLQVELEVTATDRAADSTPLSELFFAKIDCSQNPSYVYEPFPCTLEVYAAEDMQIAQQISIRGGLPTQGLKNPLAWQQRAQELVEIDGRRFIKNTFVAEATAIRAGRFAFQPQVELSLLVPRQSRRSFGMHDPFFGDFFGRSEQRPILLECNRVTVDVQSLPQKNRPENFTGGVGSFTLEAALSHAEISVGEPLTLQMRIEGRGHLDTMRAPTLPDHPAYKTYPPQSVQSDVQAGRMFEQNILITSEELTEIPALTLSYFDPHHAAYRTLQAGPFPIRVTAASASNEPPTYLSKAVPSSAEKEKRAYLKPRPAQWQSAFTLTPKRLLLLLTPLLGWLILWGLFRLPGYRRAEKTAAPTSSPAHSPSAQATKTLAAGGVCYPTALKHYQKH